MFDSFRARLMPLHQLDTCLTELKQQGISVSEGVLGENGSTFEVMGFVLTAEQIVKLYHHGQLDANGIKAFARVSSGGHIQRVPFQKNRFNTFNSNAIASSDSRTSEKPPSRAGACPNTGVCSSLPAPGHFERARQTKSNRLSLGKCAYRTSAK